MQVFQTSYHFIPLRSKYFPQHPVLCFSLNVRDQVSHPYRTTGKLIVLSLIVNCLKIEFQRNTKFITWSTRTSYFESIIMHNTELQLNLRSSLRGTRKCSFMTSRITGFVTGEYGQKPKLHINVERKFLILRSERNRLTVYDLHEQVHLRPYVKQSL
jgi:hypothetical protein